MERPRRELWEGDQNIHRYEAKGPAWLGYLRQVTIPLWPTPGTLPAKSCFPQYRKEQLLCWARVGQDATLADRVTSPTPV